MTDEEFYDCFAPVTDFTDAFNYYLTRGGFIQDHKGRWCKDGDLVLVENANIGIDESVPCKLCWDKDEYQFRLEQERILFSIEDTFISLYKPCGPDVCKDFEEE